MPFINTSAHEKFIQLVHSSFTGDTTEPADEEHHALKTDMEQLQKIVQEYKKTFSHLQGLTHQYRILLRNTRVNIRKRQLKMLRKQRVR